MASLNFRVLRDEGDNVIVGWDPGAPAFLISGKGSGRKSLAGPGIQRVKDFPPCNTRIRKAEEYILEVLGVVETHRYPPPSSPGLLSRKPPNYVGGDPRRIESYSGLVRAPEPTFSPSSGFKYKLENTKDYFIELGLKEWSSYGFPVGSDARTQLEINGGRSVVIVGGELRFNSTNKTDDCGGLRVVGGDPSGTVYVEGAKFTSVNAFTWSSGRNGIFQYCHAKVRTWNDDYSDGNHPDIFQIWDGSGQAELYFDYFTGWTTYTGLTVLTLDQPKRWTRHHTDLHFDKRLSDGKQQGNYMLYLSGGNEVPATIYDGGDTNYMDLGIWGGIPEQLQMAIDSPSWTWKPTYVIRHNGQEYTGTDPNQFRGSLAPVGGTDGDQWRCTSIPNVTERWIRGKPPGGEYVPADKVGVGYEPVGYIA